MRIVNLCKITFLSSLRVNGSHAGSSALSVKVRVMLGSQEAANSSGQVAAHRSGQEAANSSGQVAALRSQDAVNSSRSFDTALNIRHSQLPTQIFFVIYTLLNEKKLMMLTSERPELDLHLIHVVKLIMV
jgi:hypothetical protein